MPILCMVVHGLPARQAAAQVGLRGFKDSWPLPMIEAEPLAVPDEGAAQRTTAT